MSCDTLNTAAIQLNVSVASLPEGFCPASMQELANAIGSRLLISPSTEFNTFAIGSTAPASNVGPWLKDCLEWFVFDDATATYVPIAKGGFNAQEYFTASGTFTVPDFVFRLKIQAFGGGGGGANQGPQSVGAGGGAAYGCSIVTVTPGQTIPFTIGAGGAAGVGVGNPGGAGGGTIILGLTAGGGVGGTSTTGGAGGTATGFDINLTGQSGHLNVTGVGDESTSNGGDAAGWGGKGGVVAASATAAGRDGTAPGGGGSSSANATSSVSGSGAGGAILIEY